MGEQELIDLARTDPERARAMIAASVSWLADDPDRFLLLPRPEPDVILLQDPPIKMMFTSAVREAVSQGLEAYAVDEVLCLRPWGFPLDHLGCDISIWHGAQDRSRSGIRRPPPRPGAEHRPSCTSILTTVTV